MNQRILKVLVLLIGIIFILPKTSFAQHTVDTNKLTEETQRSSNDDDRLDLVWWIPYEFWEAVFENDPEVTAADADEILDLFEPYTTLMVVDGAIGPFGSVKYRSKEEIGQGLRIIDTDGNTYEPLEESDVEPGTLTMLAMMKPVLSNMLGPMGSNIEFYLFPGKNKKGKALVEPAKEGTFTVQMGDLKHVFRLPLGSLLPPKYCPVDNESLSGAWKYCPFHGKELKATR